MIRRREGASCIGVLLAFVIYLSATLPAFGAPDVPDIMVVVESFQRLAVLVPDVAGEVWMSDVAYKDWSQFVDQLDDHAIGIAVCFVHAVPLAGESDNGSPYGGLYSPWLGMLLLFQLDENATTITGFSLLQVTEPIEATANPVELSMALMASIEAGSAAFEGAVGLGGGGDRSTFVARVGDYDKILTGVYSSEAPVGRTVEAVLGRLYTGDFAAPLSLLKGEEEYWIASLTPIWFGSGAGSSIVILASTASSFNLAWLEIDEADGGKVESVSLIRLFDSVKTRGGEES